MSTKSTIRTVYLYLFALVGLALTVIGLVSILNLVLKTYVFKVESPRNTYYVKPTEMTDSQSKTLSVIEKLKATDDVNKDKIVSINLKDDQIKALDEWIKDYNYWKENDLRQQEENNKIDYNLQDFNRTMSNTVSMIIIGFPVYLFHWIVIIRDIKKTKEFGE